MDGMIQLYSQYRETEEKRAMGFRMTDWDEKLLKYGQMFVSQMMDLTVNISLEDALDSGWKILAECFQPEESGFRSDLINKYWPKPKVVVSSNGDVEEEKTAEIEIGKEPATQQ